MNPKYPVYIISKGRADTRLTARALERIHVPFKIVIEPQEFDSYSEHIPEEKILVLPFSNLGQGSIPARNWVWDHAVAAGAKRHWILDDNIRRFYRLQENKRIPIADGTIFRLAEAFVDRYENVALAGFEYASFMPGCRNWRNPIRLNARIYSCILIDNSIPFRWRGRYNEDTDLSIRILKSGLCTILFLGFLQGKTATMKMKGGNTDELYKQDDKFDGRLEMARSLYRQHPEIVQIKRRYGRWQHVVDYSELQKNKLIEKPDAERIPEWTMTLKPLERLQ